MDERNKALEVAQNDISFSKSTDYFIYSSFFEDGLCPINSKELRYAETVLEAVFYIRHILLYDVLNDLLDDLEYDFKSPFSKKQSDVVAILNFWFKFGKRKSEKQLFKLCDDFNNQFLYNKDLHYEIYILKGTEELKKFLISKFKTMSEYDRHKLDLICNKDHFVAKELKDFIEKLLGT